MVKFITLGKFENKYKYVIFYILTMLPLEYFLGDNFPDEMKIKYLRREYFPNPVFVYEIFKYLGILIVGLIISRFETENIFPVNNPSNIEKKESSMDVELILEEKEILLPNYSSLSISIIICIFVIELKSSELFYLVGLYGLDFWMIEIIFIAMINIFLFKIKIYIHQKLAISIILIFSTLMEILSIISVYNSGGYRIYFEYSWLIIIGILGFLIFFFADAYVLCKMKWFFDLKFISEKRMLISFGFFGIIVFLISSMISHFVECQTSTFSSVICYVYDEENSSKYVDNFKIFFKNIWMEDRNPFVNLIYILILLLKILLSAFHYFFAFLIVKILSPEYLVCSDSILYFIMKIITLIYYLATNNVTTDFVFDFLSQIFSILGTIIYLELIELNFCGLNHNVKKNINIRAKTESSKILRNNSDEQSIAEFIRN